MLLQINVLSAEGTYLTDPKALLVDDPDEK